MNTNFPMQPSDFQHENQAVEYDERQFYGGRPRPRPYYPYGGFFGLGVPGFGAYVGYGYPFGGYPYYGYGGYPWYGGGYGGGYGMPYWGYGGYGGGNR